MALAGLRITVHHDFMDARNDLPNGWVTDAIRSQIEESEVGPRRSFDNVDDLMRALGRPSQKPADA